MSNLIWACDLLPEIVPEIEILRYNVLSGDRTKATKVEYILCVYPYCYVNLKDLDVFEVTVAMSGKVLNCIPDIQID